MTKLRKNKKARKTGRVAIVPDLVMVKTVRAAYLSGFIDGLFVAKGKKKARRD